MVLPPGPSRAAEAPAAAPAAADAGAWSDLPPPPARIDVDADQRLQLELVVNGMESGIVVPVVKRRDRFEVRTADLRRTGMQFASPAETIFPDDLEGVAVDYDAARQQLHLTVSPRYLPSQRIGASREGLRRAAQDTGALLNYDLYVTGGGNAPTQASLWQEARVFGPMGVLSSTGVLQTGTGRPFIRYDTHWRWSDERTMTTVEAGDVITRTLSWASAVRLGGAQVSRDFAVRPDVVTYPLPEFAGTAALPSTVDLIVNGQRIAGSRVNPGPFSLDTLPPINGRGEANLIVTDMQGRSIATSMPFYVSSTLLRPGLTDYSLAAGALRRNYGRRSFDYGAMVAGGYARHGLTDGVTLEMRAELAQELRLIGGGAVVKLGNFGVASASYSRSFGDGASGGQLALGYEYQTQRFTLGVQHIRQDRDYLDLGLIDSELDGGRERTTAATASLSLGSAGTLGVGYFELRDRSRDTTRFANASWALPLWGQSRLYATLSREFADRGWSGALTLTLPLGSGTVSGGVTRDEQGRMGLRADYSRPVPTDGGIGLNASAWSEDGASPYLRGDVIWRTQPIQLRAGAYGRDAVTGWFGASGSLVFMDGALFAANRVTDAFAVVNTGGEAGVPVRYENQLIGETNRHGQLMIPTASAYYPARYDIDTLSLPPNVKATEVSRKVAIAAGSGHVIRFDVERMTPARAILTDAGGTPLPAGAIATTDRGETTYVGWDGMLYLENVAPDNAVTVQLPAGASCRVRFTAQASGDGIIDLGRLACRP
ncbi:fimbria/pilus outer membrane usher protein [Novosphingobium resinovorum]|uniref:fimbria/pilus outer membrane usher protein n=1 Tax=Novosphingobium resinovorum TaxID=158500 RepID=UPI002ED0587A|nr:fimbria/pilus outer membrane usher protein [Novosphingobium resinovorum]